MMVFLAVSLAALRSKAISASFALRALFSYVLIAAARALRIAYCRCFAAAGRFAHAMLGSFWLPFC